MEQNKTFDEWNEQKKELAQNNEPNVFPKEGWVWICAIGFNIGFEQNGTGKIFERPVLVVKKFNNKMFWVAPLSTKQKQFDFYYNFIDPNNMKGSVILAQLRLVSVKRFIRDMYKMNDTDIANITEQLKAFLDKSKPRF